MDIYLTFYDTPQRNTLNIANGFSFGREGMEDYVDLFFHRNTQPSVIERQIAQVSSERGEVNRIFCSVSYYSLLHNLRSLLDERWVLGGPAIAGLVHRKLKLPATLVAVPFERFAGNGELSSRFAPYFTDFARKISESGFPLEWLNFSCAIGSGCYWNKCNFCDHKFFNTSYIRPDVRGIMERIPENDFCKSRVHLCFSSITPGVFEEILNSRKNKNVVLASFIRADTSMIEILKNYPKRIRPCKGIGFGIGLESLSQSLVERLNKGIRVENVVKLAGLILERGGSVSVSLMDHYACMTKEMVRESKATLETLKKVFQRFPSHRSAIRMGGVTVWSSRDAAHEMSNGFEIEAFEVYGFFKRYRILIPEGSAVWNYNREVSLAIKQSGIRLAESSNKTPFLSLGRN
jgi:hypothetical protein